MITRRRRGWIAVAAMLLLVGWLLAFSAHAHSADDVEGGSNGNMHFCQLCAAFPAAAGPPSQAWLNESVGTHPRVAVTSVSFRDTAPSSSYRSRAPPSC